MGHIRRRGKKDSRIGIMDTRRKEISALLSEIRQRTAELEWARDEAGSEEDRICTDMELIELREGLASLLETGHQTRQRRSVKPHRRAAHHTVKTRRCASQQQRSTKPKTP